MVFLFIYHYYEVIADISSGVRTNNNQLVVGSVVEIVFVIAAITFFIA
jgi:hypothetical protein